MRMRGFVLTRRILTLMTYAAALACGAGLEDEVRKAESGWVAAITKNDMAGLEKVLADDLVYTHSTGIVDSKASYIQSLRGGNQRYEGVTHEDMKVQVYGNTGVLTAKVRMTGKTKGVPFDNQLRVVHVWVKQRSGDWQLVAHQTTRLP